MPLSKLTLSADKQLVRRAKRLAAKRRTSLSAMFSRFLSALVDPEASNAPIGPLTRRALGLARGIPDVPVRDLMPVALADKYKRHR